jgi:hypothetical protein
MKINIKRIPDESTQIVNGKANCLARNSESEMVVTLIGNPKGFCKSTQTRLEGQGYRLLIELKKISPECCQKIEAPFKPRIRMDKFPVLRWASCSNALPIPKSSLFNNNPLSGIAERPIVLKMKGEKPNNQNR